MSKATELADELDAVQHAFYAMGGSHSEKSPVAAELRRLDKMISELNEDLGRSMRDCECINALNRELVVVLKEAKKFVFSVAPHGNLLPQINAVLAKVGEQHETL